MRPFGPLAGLCLLLSILLQLALVVHPCKEIKLKFDLQRMVERTAKKICAGTPRITRGMGTNITLEPGERAEFLCAVDHHVHLIPSVLPSHSGTYSCVAENVLGQTKAEAYLAVNGALKPPSNQLLNSPMLFLVASLIVIDLLL